VIFIVVKHQVRPEYADQWAELMAAFTKATRSEPGVISFDWTRSLDDPNELVLIEAFRGAEAGAAHVASTHFKDAIARLPDLLSAPPQIVHADIDAVGWSTMSEVVVGDR
jgi:quinol monooxygenase YgiN